MSRKVFDLECDVRNTDWVIRKLRTQEIYAQNFYAALCDNSFAPMDTWSILANLVWNCSWMYAADLVSSIRGDDSYIDWYCSGTGFHGIDFVGFVEESHVTDEIGRDFEQIGWIILSPAWAAG